MSAAEMLEMVEPSAERLAVHAARDAELKAILTENGGVLRPSDVVEYARNPNTVIHNYFTWDDSEAAEKYRLVEARRLIRLHVEFGDNPLKGTRVFYSLVTDRMNPGGGYRATVDILSDEDQAAILLGQAKADAARFKNKYAKVKELSAVFAAMDEVPW